MTLTRWKLMAGVLGLSLCGLAALAEPACRSLAPVRRGDEPMPKSEGGAKPVPIPVLPPPIEVTPPKPIETALPLPAPVSLPPATEVPAAVPVAFEAVPIPAPSLLLPVPAPKPVEVKIEQLPVALPALPFPSGEVKAMPVMDEKLFQEVAKGQLNLPPLPTLNSALPLPAPKAGDRVTATPGTTFTTFPALPQPVAKPFENIELPVRANTAPVFAEALPLPKPMTAVGFEVPLPSAPTPSKDEKPSNIQPLQFTGRTVEVSPDPYGPKAPAANETRKLKVQLNLGGGKPWFEVRDGEELVLKVVADAVEVKAPAENGDTASTLKASGNVSFRTLGGNGTCDELRVVPGSGEVVVVGKVSVTSNWGKAETIATAEKMTFRLGTDLGAGKK